MNVYSYADLRADPIEMLLQYYDAFLYEANWGTRELMFRLPTSLVQRDTLSLYELEDGVKATVRGKHIALDFLSQDEDGYGWIDEEDSGAWLDRLLPIRAELTEGDYRALYLGWLLSVQGSPFEDEDEADEQIEPPVPAGLGALSASCKALPSSCR